MPSPSSPPPQSPPPPPPPAASAVQSAVAVGGGEPAGGAVRTQRWWLRAMRVPPLLPRQERALVIAVCISVATEYAVLLDSLSIDAQMRSLQITVDDVAEYNSIASLGGLLGIGYALFADTVGRRPFFVVGLPLLAAQRFAIAAAPTGSWWCVATVFGRLIPGVPALLYLVEELDPDGRGAVASLVAVGAVLGAGACLGVWALCGDAEWGWRVMYAAAGAPVAFFAVRVLCGGPGYLPESRLFRPATGSCVQRVGRPVRSLWAHSMRPLLLMAAVNTFFNLGDSAAGKFLLARLGSGRDGTGCGFSSAHVSVLTAVSGAVALPCLLLSGRVNDRCGRVPTGSALWVGTALTYGLYYSASCDSYLLFPYFILVVVVAQFLRAAVTQTLQQEVWRTEHRASAGILLGPVNSLTGSIGFALYPILRDPPSKTWHVGSWTVHGWGLGDDRALAVLSQFMLGAAVAWAFLPETGGKALPAAEDEEPEEGPEEAPGASAAVAEGEPLLRR